MANNISPRDAYIDTLRRQTTDFEKQFDCSTSPSFYIIYYDDGAAHWSSSPWGWGLNYLNLKEGDPKQCGKAIGSGIAICKQCHTEKGNEIRKVCRKFNGELKENHRKEIDKERASKSSHITKYCRNHIRSLHL